MSNLNSILKKYKLDWKLISILAIAAFFRFFLLDLRPAHHDEGVFGWFVDQITANGFYRYDPTNYHGPLHYYVLFLSQTLFGRSNWALRLPDAIISLLAVYWITLFSRFFERRTCLLAALAMALSPGIVYFSGYAFQESFQVFYTILVLWGIMGLWHEGTKKYLWVIGLGITLMILTKETYVIHFSCFILAWITLILWEKLFPSIGNSVAKQSWTSRDLIYVFVTGMGLIIFFYSGTFFNFQGVIDFFHWFQAWFKTGVQQTGHAKPFYYWAKLILKYEHITLIGVFCVIRYLFPSNKWIRYIAIYGIGVFLAYSIIPYKTTWCIINLLWPFYFVFGDFANELLKTRAHKLVYVIYLVLFVISTIILCRINFITYSDNKEPYVYVHTFKDIKRIIDPVFKLVERDRSQYNLVGNVIRQDEWPLPWIFGDFTMIGYYNPQVKPQKYDADFLFVETRRIYEVEQELKNKYFTDTFTMRDAQDPSKLYLSYEKFKDIFPNRAPEFIPKPPEPILPGQGLLAIFYPNSELKGTPAFKKVMRRIDIYLDEHSTPLPPPFGIELIGEINIPLANTTLTLISDDGGYVEIDGQRIIEDLGSHGQQSKSRVINNMTGWRKIKIGYYDIWGWAVLQLKWIDANGNEVFVPANALRFREDVLKK